MKYNVGVAILGVAAILLTSCGDAPQKEIDAANAAIDSAKVAGAEVYASESFVALQDSMQAIVEAIEAEKSNFFANYSASKEQLAYISQQAAVVVKEADAKKLEIKSQIQSTITEVKELINTNKQLILEAPKGKEGTSALVAIQGELSAIEMAVSETDSLMSAGQLIPGLDKASLAKQKASSINTELQTVIDKYKANVKARRG